MAVVLVLVSVFVLGAALFRSLATRKSGDGHVVEVFWPEDDAAKGAALLVAAGVIETPGTFRIALALARPLLHTEPGPHLLRDDLSPAEVIRRLARLSSRERVRVLVPEGWNRFQIADRLESLSVCSRRAFDLAATDRAALDRLAVSGDSAEGYLFPATYDLYADMPAAAVVTEMVGITRARFASLRTRHVAGFQTVGERYRWGEHEILTLASMVEREAARTDEQPIIASVFFNRLDSVDFKPVRTLQSDPTAAYGCLVHPELASCRGLPGRVTPEMLRDPENPYNTYRHAGLPPGPIANPGERAIEAVLSPATTHFMFFVASGDGHHTFTESLEDHDAAVQKRR